MEFSREILQLEKLQGFLYDNEKAKNWGDLLDLMNCPWFSRRWVVQELAFARAATVHLRIFALHFDRIRALFRQSKADKIYRKAFSNLESLGAKIMVDAINNVFQSMLPQTRAGEVSPPVPNYENALVEVYTDFLEWVVSSTSSIDILCRQWAMPERSSPIGWKNPTAAIALPSWVQTISKSTWGFQVQGFNGRINADSLVGKPGRSRYNASYGKKPIIRFGTRRRFIAMDSGPSLRRTNTAPGRFESVPGLDETPEYRQ
ncbi:Uu.00g033160.m01.CDS01 [Anthostomella pinea]|uniref:Uu.00g033160.m01.CDS01 n=1 Tax=Anthostomella pinea TaxID=933095 RepID=A0AAI8YDD4_9PEZI|nr:Uu.00g033160.m01.CDS01 [Anthostomella pinea]